MEIAQAPHLGHAVHRPCEYLLALLMGGVDYLTGDEHLVQTERVRIFQGVELPVCHAHEIAGANLRIDFLDLFQRAVGKRCHIAGISVLILGD